MRCTGRCVCRRSARALHFAGGSACFRANRVDARAQCALDRLLSMSLLSPFQGGRGAGGVRAGRGAGGARLAAGGDWWD